MRDWMRPMVIVCIAVAGSGCAPKQPLTSAGERTKFASCKEAWNLVPTTSVRVETRVPTEKYLSKLTDKQKDKLISDIKETEHLLEAGKICSEKDFREITKAEGGWIGTNGDFLMGVGLEGYWFEPENSARTFTSLQKGDVLVSDTDQTPRPTIKVKLGRCDYVEGRGYRDCEIEEGPAGVCRDVIIVAGHWEGRDGKYTSNEDDYLSEKTVTLSCAKNSPYRGIIAKCVSDAVDKKTGLRGWEMSPINAKHEAGDFGRFLACVRAVHGDFCGNLRGFRLEGELIDIRDNAGVGKTEISCAPGTDGDDMCFEALWDYDGAVWVSRLAWARAQGGMESLDCINRRGQMEPGNVEPERRRELGEVRRRNHKKDFILDETVVMTRHHLLGPELQKCTYKDLNSSSIEVGSDIYCTPKHEKRSRY